MSFLLVKRFFVIIVIANIIAIPTAYYLTGRWLQNFAFKADLNINVFIFSSFMTFLIALLTISYQVFKGVTLNPVKTLRNE
jgi:putative ABC transport system permease protein